MLILYKDVVVVAINLKYNCLFSSVIRNKIMHQAVSDGSSKALYTEIQIKS